MEQQKQVKPKIDRFKSIRESLKTISILSKNTQHVKNRIAYCNQDQSPMNNNQDSPNQSPHFKMEFTELMSDFQQKYQMLEKIGEGSNGIVRKCMHKVQQKIYAVKSINIDEQHIYFLQKNFLKVKHLHHESIVEYKSYYINRKKHLYNLVMEYIDWPNLLAVKIKDETELKNIMSKIFEVIDFLHKKSVCHRDIKPQNILYNQKNGKIKIIDFGISKKLIQRNATKQMLTFTGTLFYRAPEMLSGGGYNQKIDEWAAGVTLFKLITGVTPFESEYHSETIENILKGQIKFDEIWDNYSGYVKDLLGRIFKPQKKRLTASQALKHVWFTSSENSPLRFNLTQSMNCEQSMQNSVKIDSGYFPALRLTKISSVLSSDEQNLFVDKWISGENKDFIDSEGQEQKNKKIPPSKLKFDQNNQ